MTRDIPVDVLEKRAQEQRSALADRVVELRQTVKERLDVKRNVRKHVWPAAGAAALVGLVLGFAATGWFTRD